MRPFPVALMSALAWMAACVLAGPASAQQFDVPASAKAAIVDQTNAYRQTKGLAPLTRERKREP